MLRFALGLVLLISAALLVYAGLGNDDGTQVILGLGAAALGGVMLAKGVRR